jgi:proteasome lid subunit RPN8/RPN11
MSKSAAKKQPAADPAKKVPIPSESTTKEPLVTIDSSVTRRIRQHARAHFKTEVCGVLIGDSTDHTIEIRASIEARNAAQAGTHVTFTQDAWEEIYKVKDEHYPDARIVGWYHSHPGFGIFLSEHDLFIQENFFSSPGQVAWVYDPHSDDEGCFGWVGGKVARITSVATLYRSVESVEHAASIHGSAASMEGDDEPVSNSDARASAREAPSAWLRWSLGALTHLSVLAAGFALAYFFFPRLLAILPDPATGQVMFVDYRELRAYFKGAGPAPKPVDVVSLPGLAAPPSPASPAASPASAPPANSPGAPPAAPAATQPAKPEGKR